MRKRGAALKGALYPPLTTSKSKTPLVFTIGTTRAKHKHLM